MATTIALRQQRAPLIEQMRDAVAHADEARAKGDTARAKELDEVFTKAEADERDLSARIARQERLEALEREQVGKHLEDLDQRGQKPSGSKENEYRSAFRTFFVGGSGRLTSEERSILGRPEPESRAQSVGTNADGGYLVPEDFMREIEKSIKDFSGVMQVAKIKPTATGAPLPMPTSDNTARKATIVAENAASSAVNFAFGQKILNAYTYRDMAAASIELMQDSAFDIGEFVNESFGESFGRGLNEHFTTGDDSGKPNGLVTASTLGHTAASATAFTRAEIIDLLHSVDSGYRQSRSCGFMFHDKVLAAIKKLALGSGDASPLWQTSMRDGAPDKLEGFPFWINNDMDSTINASSKLMLFGDFSRYHVRRVLGMTLLRLQERFIDSGQIGFIAFARYDGELMNTAAVKHLITAA